ncbi:hypothetical protein EYV94_20970 [Puteibacter caeruleilacunae]|nr:hypothetical protein EYV94_20970 [Puteibacter caeruleilacunae]
MKSWMKQLELQNRCKLYQEIRSLQMKLLNNTLLITALIGLITYCNPQPRDCNPQEIAADSLWQKFAYSLETRDTTFLINNSLDTIQCAEFSSENEYFASEFIFKNHIKKLMHLDSLRNADYNIYVGDSLMHINYPIKTNKTIEGGYNLIFSFSKVENRFVFRGMLLTP